MTVMNRTSRERALFVKISLWNTASISKGL